MHRRALMLGLGGATIVTPAFADQAFTTFGYNATGGTTPRTSPARWADVINVLDYGADPTDTNNSSPAIQAAFDAAFGSSSSPHGSASATSNRPVFFPNGKYKIGTTLNLTRVVGGHIFGAGPGATYLDNQTGAALLYINGASNLVFERMRLVGGSTSSGIVGIDLDWDGTVGGDGLHDNLFRDLLIEQCNIGVRIAHTTSSAGVGANNLFQHVTLNQHITGILAEGTGAVNNTTILGGGGTLGVIGTDGVLYWSKGGSIHSYEPSVGNSAATQPTYGFRVDSGLPVNIVGGRAEYNTTSTNNNLLKVTNGFVSMRAFNMAQGDEFANITGGKVTFDGCLVSNAGNGKINGAVATASLTISGSTLTVSGVSGTVAVGQVVYGTGVPGSNGSAPGTLSPIIISGSGSTWTLNYAPGNISGVSGTCGSAVYLRGCFLGSLAGYSGNQVQNS